MYSSSVRRRCRSPKISMRSVTSLRTVSTNLSAYAFALGLRGGILHTVMPASASTASNVLVNWPAWSRTRTVNWSARSPRSMSRFLAVGRSTARPGCDAEDVRVAAGDLQYEAHVPALQREGAVDV